MVYRVLYECNNKKVTIELTLFDFVIDSMSEDDIDSFLQTAIEHEKSLKGLENIPHKIIKTEFSIDGENWFNVQRNIK
jgi:hypothetical protein